MLPSLRRSASGSGRCFSLIGRHAPSLPPLQRPTNRLTPHPSLLLPIKNIPQQCSRPIAMQRPEGAFSPLAPAPGGASSYVGGRQLAAATWKMIHAAAQVATAEAPLEAAEPGGASGKSQSVTATWRQLPPVPGRTDPQGKGPLPYPLATSPGPLPSAPDSLQERYLQGDGFRTGEGGLATRAAPGSVQDSPSLQERSLMQGGTHCTAEDAQSRVGGEARLSPRELRAILQRRAAAGRARADVSAEAGGGVGAGRGGPAGGPRALKWVKQCCPGVPVSLLHKLFRKKLVRARIAPLRVERAEGESESHATADHAAPLGLPPWRKVLETDVLPPGTVLHLPGSIEVEAGGRAGRRPSDLPAVPDQRDIDWLRSLILHKDSEMIVLNKPPGLAVQGGTGVQKDLDSLMEHALAFDSPERPRLVHRLDRDTSGAMVVARTTRALKALHLALREKTAAASVVPIHRHHSAVDLSAPEIPFRRTYWALVEGVPSGGGAGRIAAPIIQASGKGGFERMALAAPAQRGALPAVTLYRTVKTCGGRTWLELTPLTGRKHQLRVHCAALLGTPILGDVKYGWRRPTEERQLDTAAMRDGGRGNRIFAPAPGGERGGAAPLRQVAGEAARLHLHCRHLALPDLEGHFRRLRQEGLDVDQLELGDVELLYTESLRFEAPLPRHMALTWRRLGFA